MTAVRFCDQGDFGFGWIVAEQLERCSHALVDEGRVWLVDPVAWPQAEERARSLGEVAGVLQLLDRHARDCAEVAGRLGVPHQRVCASEPQTPFEAVRLATPPGWREVALWWPERRVLVCADALGTARYFRALGERLAVHPLLRLVPPRRLARFAPEAVLVGHGEGVLDGATAALEEALRTSRRRLPRWLAAVVRSR